jgi:hypothetical protein
LDVYDPVIRQFGKQWSVIDMQKLDGVRRRFDNYRLLMPTRITEILLVSSLYDAYTLEEDGTLEEILWDQYLERGLSQVPHIRKVPDVQTALTVIRNEKIDLVLTMSQAGDESTLGLARKAKAIRASLPIALLATDRVSLERLAPVAREAGIDRVFLWHNDPGLLLAIIKYFEDLANIDHDTKLGGVRAILLVEDSISHYSAFLPTMYTVIMQLTRQLIDDGLNHLHKQLRMRSRAKVILAETYEEAQSLVDRYGSHILGVISDVQFWKDGELCDQAGFELTRMLRSRVVDLPICLQSADPDKNRAGAEELRVYFVDKNSPSMLSELRTFLKDYMGFGDFVFRGQNGQEFMRAANTKELIQKLKTAPLEAVLYHAGRQDFSHWMRARGELIIADQLYPKRITDFPEPEMIRNYIITVIEQVQRDKQRDVITEYKPGKDPKEMEFMRLGRGSLGGKARGIAFLRFLLSRVKLDTAHRGVKIVVPSTLVICSVEFERFLDDNGLRPVVLDPDMEYKDLKERFVSGRIHKSLRDNLRAYLEKMNVPLAVRSSSILEDSQHLPLAGLYDTVMLPNNRENMEDRLTDLVTAIKLVWASTFGPNPKAYFKQSNYRVEEEHMSVIIQQIGGSEHGSHFYPTFSGVAQSHNFYPVSYMKPEEGIVQIAMGLGKMVVEGGSSLRFSPRYPQLLPQFSNSRDWLYLSQKQFYGLSLAASQNGQTCIPGRVELLPLTEAEDAGVLQQIGSVYQQESDLLVDSFFYKGPRVVTFNKVLKNSQFPLCSVLIDLLGLCEDAMRTPAEIEFAVDIPKGSGVPTIYLLQLRPMTSRSRWQPVVIDDNHVEAAVGRTRMAHGNGIYENINDIVLVKPETFEKRFTREIAAEVGDMNKRMVNEGRPYMLIGYGRWGSTDPWMGIGVQWSQIAGVKVLVEVGLPDFNVDPSQGTHFFQNVTSLNIGCISIPHGDKYAMLDWDWLHSLPVIEDNAYTSLLRPSSPIEVRIDGRNGNTVILDTGRKINLAAGTLGQADE